jgi:hypothetical protein
MRAFPAALICHLATGSAKPSSSLAGLSTGGFGWAEPFRSAYARRCGRQQFADYAEPGHLFVQQYEDPTILSILASRIDSFQPAAGDEMTELNRNAPPQWSRQDTKPSGIRSARSHRER